MSGVMKTCVVKFIRQGVGISLTDVEYADSTSSTEAPTAGWQTNAPTWQNGHYIWTRTKIVYTDGTTRYSNPVCLPSGKGIVSIEEQYYKSTSATTTTGGSWQGTPPTWESGRYIWTRSKITYTDGTTAYTDPVNTTGATGATGPQGPTGPTGPQGPAGQDGKDGKDGTNGTNGVSFRKINAAAREYTLALWHQYGDPGHTETWGVSGYDNSHIVVGDTVYITGKVSDCKDAAGNKVDVMAFGTCTAKTSTVITMYTTNLIIGGTKGDKGDNGGRGPALRGPQDWNALPTSYYFYQGADGETYKDVVLYGGNFYSCIKTHNKRSGVVPTDATYWQLADKVEIIASKILLSTYALIQNLGASAIEMKDPNTGQTLFYAKDGTVSCKVGIFENVTVSGTVKGITGSFKQLNCVNDSGAVICTMRFGSDGRMWFEDGDLYHQGTKDGRSLRFYTSMLWCRGSFGARQRNTLVVNGTYGYYHTNGISQSGVYISFSYGTAANGDRYYKIPCYGQNDDYSGFPVDTVIFSINSSSTYRYNLEMAETQRVLLINANDNYNNAQIYTNGSIVTIDGGMVGEVVMLPVSKMIPQPASNLLGRGIVLGQFRDNDWG